PSVSIFAITSSATTISPSFLMTCASTPADGAGTSSTTLSVSISIRISSWATASPGFFFQLSMVASATDSDSCGTLTSTIAMVVNSSCMRVFFWQIKTRRSPARAAVLPQLLGQNKALELGESGVQQCLLLLVVLCVVTHCRRSGSGSTGITELLAFRHVFHDVVLDEEPGTLVLGLVLAPQDFVS